MNTSDTASASSPARDSSQLSALGLLFVFMFVLRSRFSYRWLHGSQAWSGWPTASAKGKAPMQQQLEQLPLIKKPRRSSTSSSVIGVRWLKKDISGNLLGGAAEFLLRVTAPNHAVRTKRRVAVGALIAG